jgi:pimeloyl-ACP methyl ester carboxylesterase
MPKRLRRDGAEAIADEDRGDGSRREHVPPQRLSRVPFDETWVRERAGVGWDRDPTAGEIVRQLTAIFASGDRTGELAHIDVPTLVIHGDRDRMVHPTGGAATARAIPVPAWKPSKASATICRSARGPGSST